MRRFLPALAALLLLLTLYACGKPGEEPTPSPAPPTEEPTTQTLTVTPSGSKGQRLVFRCPVDWEYYGYSGIDYQGQKLVETNYSPAEEKRTYLQKMEDIRIKQLGEREFYTYSEEYGILEGPEMTPGVEEKKVYLYTIWNYYFFDGEDCYRIALFENQEREQVVSIPDFEDILAGLEIEKPLGTTENAVGYEKMELGGFSLWLPEGTTCEDGSLRNERAGTEFLATVPSVESITDKAAPFAVYDETFSDSYRVEEHEFGGYAAKSYHRSWEEPDDALPMKMHEVIYCIDTGDEMIRLTLTPLIGLGVGTQCEMFEKILNSIEVG